MAQDSQQKFMILFDTATSPNNEFLLACSTYGDIFVWNISSILGNKNKLMTSVTNTSNTKVLSSKFDDYDESDSDEDYDCDIHDNANDTKIDNIVTEIEPKKYNSPLFSFRPFPCNIREPVYRLKTINNLLFVGTFHALYIYKWEDIIHAIQTNDNNIKTLHKYVPPQIEYKYGAKSRFVEINCMVYNKNNDSVFLGSGHSDIFELNINKLQLTNTLSEHNDYILDLSINANNNLLTSSSNDGTLKVWNLKNEQNTKSVVTFNQNNSDAYYANCCQLHENGRYVVGGFAVNKNDKNKSNKICLYELNMRSLITEIGNNNNYIPQVVRFSNIWRHSNQSNLSIVAGYNNCNLYLFDKNYNAINKKNNKTNNDITIQTSSKSIWSVNVSQNIAFVCGASKYVDLIASTANVITSLSV